MRRSSYLRFDEREDVIASIELCAFLAPTLNVKPLFWKWVLVSVHNALNGALVCALSGTAGIGSLKPKSAKKMLDWLESGNGPYPQEWLADFETLLEWAQDKARMSYLEGEPLSLTQADAKDLKKLNSLRRNFVHFTPKGWSIEKAGLPRIILAAARLTETLMLEHPSARLHLSPAQSTRLNQAFGKVRRLFSVGTTKKPRATSRGRQAVNVEG